MMKKKWKKIVLFAVCMLLIALVAGCGSVKEEKETAEKESVVQEIAKEENAYYAQPEKEKAEEDKEAAKKQEPDLKSAEPSYKAEPAEKIEREKEPQIEAQNTMMPREEAEPTPKQEEESKSSQKKGIIAEEEHSTMCTLYVHCKEIMQNEDKLKEHKKSVIPSNYVIYEKREVSFQEGESVFDVLKREMKQSKTPFEFVYTPIYHSVYIEGIGNLYEFDCGELSGWQYRVNGVKPNYGCSQYIIKDNDAIEFYFSCDFTKENG